MQSAKQRNWQIGNFYFGLCLSRVTWMLVVLFISFSALANQNLSAPSFNNQTSTKNATQITLFLQQSASGISRPISIRPELLREIDHHAITLMQAGRLSEARAIVTQAIDKINYTEETKLLINRIIIRALIDEKVGAYIGALQDLQFAFRLASTTNQQHLVADVAFFIASIHQVRNEHSIALSYAQQALNTYRAINRSEPIPVLLLTTSSLLATRQIDEALALLQKVAPLLAAADIAVPLSQSAFIEQLTQQKAEYFQYLGEAELYKENISQSIEALNIAITLTNKQNFQQLATQNLLLSQAYTVKDDMDSAIDHLVTAFKFAEKSNSPFYLNQALQLHRANLLGQLNDFESAYRLTQDVLKSRELNQPIAEIKRMLDMHANFQLDLQQQENAELKQENQWKTEQIETKQMLNKLYFLIIGLLVCFCCLLLLMFVRGKKHRLSLEKIAHTDALTDLHSRTQVLKLLTNHQDLFNRNGQEYCVAVVDLDFFKKINDQYGHQTGDEVLKMFGTLSKSSFRKTDILGRIGGEEFLFILPHTHSQQAIEVFNQFNAKLPKISEQLKLSQAVSASIGLVTPFKQEKSASIIKRADTALYEAKHQGRNCVVFGNKVVSLQSHQSEVN
jgi:diguanylate cyclase (GGDEF)-like protein